MSIMARIVIVIRNNNNNNNDNSAIFIKMTIVATYRNKINRITVYKTINSFLPDPKPSIQD